MKLTHFCPAKVNLFLEVTGKRPNGYHELATLFAKINLGDTLTVEATPASTTEISLTMTGPIASQLQAGPNNLVWRAAEKFLDFFHLQATVALTLDKHIPTGAGLGGGSSDAAGVLLCLCKIFDKNPLSLIETAAKLGADVPLFLYESAFLKGEGIGEKLTPIPSKGTLPWLVLVYPNINIPTKEVFARLRLPSHTEILTNILKLDKLIDAVEKGAPLSHWRGLFFNRLEECVLPFAEPVADVYRQLQEMQSDMFLMSGSGSTLFILTETEQAALQLVRRLETMERTCFIASFLTDPEQDVHNRN